MHSARMRTLNSLKEEFCVGRCVLGYEDLLALIVVRADTRALNDTKAYVVYWPFHGKDSTTTFHA